MVLPLDAAIAQLFSNMSTFASRNMAVMFVRVRVHAKTCLDASGVPRLQTEHSEPTAANCNLTRSGAPGMMEPRGGARGFAHLLKGRDYLLPCSLNGLTVLGLGCKHQHSASADVSNMRIGWQTCAPSMCAHVMTAVLTDS